VRLDGLVANFLAQRIRTAVAGDNGRAWIAVWNHILEEASRLAYIVLKINADCVDTSTTDAIGVTSR
jgi:hypothetical protein